MFRYAYSIKENSGRWNVFIDRLNLEKVVNKKGKLLGYNTISRENIEFLTSNDILTADKHAEETCRALNKSLGVK